MAKLLRDALKGALKPEQVRAVETGIDIIGDIAIVKLAEPVKDQGTLVGNAILAGMKNVKAVFDQEGGLEGDFRLRRLRFLVGENRTLTTHRENGLRFMVDVEKCYFSPRLSTERLRIADMVGEGEKVLNMFAGVGPYSITVAKRSNGEVWSCELNETAFNLHVENNRLNKVVSAMHMYNEDARRLPELLETRFDRVLMPHPSQSNRFLPEALELAKPGGWIHYYRHHSGADATEAKAALDDELVQILGESGDYTSRRVREIGPHYVELVADIRVRR
ncbi:MAG: RsmD family RNA methyltransferase [Thaumarchaeota archaeon]|nr:RsmD family RNA methyltransferase [Nitrososphaerota archaeon]